MVLANKPVLEQTCDEEERKAIVDILDRLGDKWTIMIVGELFHGPIRYGELQRRVGVISQRMLTLTLKGLLDDGLVSRTLYPSIPPRVDYELTDLGFSLRESLRPLWEWASKNMHSVAASREARSKSNSKISATIADGIRDGTAAKLPTAVE